MPAISAHDLRKSFPAAGRRRRGEVVEAVAGISFEVEEGERLAYIGPNGAGESTSIKMLTGILHPTSGEATIGLDLVAKTRFRELIVRINEQRGTTILLPSHDVSDIEQVARRVIVINHGRLIYDDTVSRMRRTLLGTKVVDVRFETEPA